MSGHVEFIPGRPHAVEVARPDGSRERVWSGDSYLDAMAEGQARAKALGCRLLRGQEDGT